MDTIAALATAAGPAGICVVRVSGPHAHAIGRGVCRGLPEELDARRLYLASFVELGSGEVLDQGLVVFFEAPESYTGEDVVELHGHGGTANARALLDAVLRAGARAARPGEFSRRAVVNERMDLVRSEGIAELVAADSEQALRAARGLFGGSLARRVERALDEVESLAAECEGLLEFPEDVDEGAVDGRWVARLAALCDSVGTLERSYDRGRRTREGARVLIAGPPNAGKSSLFNALLGEERAIVHAAPGTTRDAVEGRLELGGFRVTLQDSAGLREAPGEVEREGVRRTEEALAGADLVLAVFDASREAGAEAGALGEMLGAAGARVLVVLNKSDLGAAGREGLRAALAGLESCATSATAGEGLDTLREALVRRLFDGAVGEGEVLVTLGRHHQALGAARVALQEARERLEAGVGVDAAVEELAEARRQLAAVLGRGALPDALLDRVFERFCIGK